MPERGRVSCLDPLEEAEGVEGGGGEIYFMKRDPGCRQGAFEERGLGNQSHLHLHHFRSYFPDDLQIPRPIFTLSIVSFSFDNTGNRIVQR